MGSARTRGGDDDTIRRAAAVVTRGAVGVAGPASLDVERTLDRLIPEAVDWRRAVERWPVAALAVVGAAGFLLGRRRGVAVVSGLRDGLSRGLAERLEGLAGASAPGETEGGRRERA